MAHIDRKLYMIQFSLWTCKNQVGSYVRLFFDFMKNIYLGNIFHENMQNSMPFQIFQRSQFQ